jgi:hypothetical protein
MYTPTIWEGLKMRRTIDKEERELLQRELREYICKTDGLSADEKKELRKWVRAGHSVCYNPDDIADESGAPVDYITWLRCYEEDFNSTYGPLGLEQVYDTEDEGATYTFF